MFGSGTKYFAGIALLLLGAATVFGVGTAANGNGHLAFSGTVILGTAAAAAMFMAWLSLEAGDAPSVDRDRENSYELVPAYWPLMSALGLGVLIVGLASNAPLAVLGVSLLIIAAFEWTFTAWADRRSTDVAANYAERRRFATPFEVPVWVVLLGAIPVALISRVLLALPRNGASWVALAAATVVLIVVFVFYAKPEIKSSIVAGVLALGMVAVVVGGIVSMAVGTRDIEQHHGDESEDHSDDEHSEEEASSAVIVQ